MFEHFTQAERAILQKRAQQIAADKDDGRAGDVHSGLRCKVGQGWYVIPLDQLSAIYRKVAVTSVPGAPPHMNGVANVRGRILPVLDLGILLEAEAATATHAELIVIDHPEGMVGLQVQQVDDVLTYTTTDLELVPEEIQTGATTAALADGTLILDTAPLLNDPHLIIDMQSQ